jgi:hypothetical protein
VGPLWLSQALAPPHPSRHHLAPLPHPPTPPLPPPPPPTPHPQVLQYYRPQLPPPEPELADPSKLRVGMGGRGSRVLGLGFRIAKPRARCRPELVGRKGGAAPPGPRAGAGGPSKLRVGALGAHSEGTLALWLLPGPWALGLRV